MTTRNLYIDPTTGDLAALVAGNLQLVSDSAAIQQAVSCALRTFLGEWFLDSTAGVPYFQAVLVKTPNPQLLRTVFIDAIEAVPGIVQVVQLDLQYVAATRSLTVSWRAQANSGLLVSGTTGV